MGYSRNNGEIISSACLQRTHLLTKNGLFFQNYPPLIRKLTSVELFKISFQGKSYEPPDPGLNKRTTSEELREAFAKFGEVIHARVVTDRVNGYSKGFGFVRYATLEDAARGIEGMNGKFLQGWVIFAEYARPREQSPQYAGAPPTPRY